LVLRSFLFFIALVFHASSVIRSSPSSFGWCADSPSFFALQDPRGNEHVFCSNRLFTGRTSPSETLSPHSDNGHLLLYPTKHLPHHPRSSHTPPAFFCGYQPRPSWAPPVLPKPDGSAPNSIVVTSPFPPPSSSSPSPSCIESVPAIGDLRDFPLVAKGRAKLSRLGCGVFLVRFLRRGSSGKGFLFDQDVCYPNSP